MLEESASDAVILAVFDGHGDAGHIVASHFRDSLPAALFASPKFAAIVEAADNIPPPSAAEAGRVAAEDEGTGGGEAPSPSRAADKKGGAMATLRFRASLRPPVEEPRARRDVGGALIDALAACEASLLARRDVDCAMSGCTGCVAVVIGSELTIANVGDSRAVLFRWVDGPTAAPEADAADSPATPRRGGGARRRALAPVTLTIDHKPSLPAETRRILLAGGRVASIT
jgi:hypothetical protein